MKRILVFALLTLCLNLLEADILNYDKVIKNQRANQEYKKKEFSKAREKYQENSLKNPENGQLHYNLGNALYKESKLDEAEAEYKMALRDQNFEDKSKLYQNMGNIRFQNQDYKNALEFFKKSLVADPTNPDARYNYEMAARYLQKQQQQQQNQDQDNQDQDKNKDKQKQQQQQQGDENKEDQKKQEQQNKQEQQKDNKEQQQQQMQKSKDQKEAEQMLKALLAKEKEDMKKEKQKQAAQNQKSGKYW